MATRGRTNGDGSVTFYDDVTGDAVLALDGDGDDAGLMNGSAPTVNNVASFADLAAVATAYNSLLAALRTRGVIGGS